MYFYHTPSGNVLTFDQVKQMIPNVSFPSDGIPADILVQHDLLPIVLNPPLPDHDPLTQHIVTGGYIEVGGVVTIEQNVVDYTEEQLAERAAMAWEQVRAHRDQKIRDVAWVVERFTTQQLAGIPPHNTLYDIQLVCNYIQELRDITLQDSPYDIQWPVNPLDPVEE